MVVAHAARAAGPSGHGQRIGPYLLKIGWDIPTVAYVTGSPAAVASRPFDGFGFDAPAINQLIHSTTAVSLSSCQSALSGMGSANFGNCNRYFPRILLQNPNNTLDYWNDSQWTTCAQNWANLAQAANAEGCHGLMLDDEWYGDPALGPWDWGSTGYQNGAQPSAPGPYGDSGSVNPNVAPGYGPDPSHDFATSRAKVQARGKQVMDAMLAVWPTVRMICLHGVIDSTSLTSPALNPPFYNDVSWANELMGTFHSGLIESIHAAGDKAMYIDGGENGGYPARSMSDHYRFNDWRTRGIKASSTTMMSSTVKSAWRLINGCGLFDKDFLTSGYPLQPASDIQNQIMWGMRNHAYTWLYTESHDWWGSGYPATPVPQAYLDAVAAGRAAGRL
jgi:hypothetical protein